MEMPGIEPGAFHMQSERSTTELHPLPIPDMFSIDFLRRSPTGYRFKVKYDTGTSLRCYILSGTDTDSYFLYLS
jgi:hypothetical protein